MKDAISLAAVFLVMVALDWVWAQYTKHVAGKRAFPGAAYAMAISVLSGVLTLFYVDVGWKVTFATGAGAFVGTYLSIRWNP